MPGSIADYEVHKRNYELYLDYLRKTPMERDYADADADAEYWSVLCDKGYVGPATDTPHEMRILPKKGTTSNEERKRNKEINHA